MRIGLLTFHDTCNFGSLLQTYGLYKAIEILGYDCEVIDYQCDSIRAREIPKPMGFTLNPKKLLYYVLIGHHRIEKYSALSRFLNEKMKLSSRCDQSSVNRLSNRYDKVIVGSDIVWGLDITGGDLTYFLGFLLESKKKYAFSSSVGNPWSENEKLLVKPLLYEFSRIAVREEESSLWVEELIGRKPQIVCDPTMLLDANMWRRSTVLNKTKNDYVLVYFDNKNRDCITSARKYAKAHGLKLYLINDGFSRDGYKAVKPHSLDDFLSLIDNAAFVVTASYHGMLFSLYFNKQFAYFNRAHKSRMNTLSKKLFVEDRNGEENDIMTMQDIDYHKVNKALDEYRAESMACLKEFLES